MSNLLNGAPLNGGVSSLWAEGHSAAEAASSADLQRHAYTASTDHWAEASQTCVPDRTAWMADTASTAEAAPLIEGTRHAYFEGTSTSEALETATPERTAWMADTVGTGRAEGPLVAERWVIPTATGYAESETVSDDLKNSVLRITRVRDTRGIARTVINEGDIDRILVNQVAASGTVIVRSDSTAIANSQLAFASSTAEAGELDDDLLVNILRDGRGMITAEADEFADPGHIQLLETMLVSDAHLYTAPDIIRADGTVEMYAWGILEGVAERTVVHGLRWRNTLAPWASAESVITLDSTHNERGVSGESIGLCETESDPAATRVNHWNWAEAFIASRAAGECSADRLAWVGASGNSKGRAFTDSTAEIFHWDWLEDTSTGAEAVSQSASDVKRYVYGEAQPEAESSAVPYKLAMASALTAGEGEMSAGFIVYHWVWVDERCVGEGVSDRAHALYEVDAVPDKPIYGEAVIEKVYFMINGSDPGPEWRTVFVSGSERSLTVPEQTREIIIS